MKIFEPDGDWVTARMLDYMEVANSDGTFCFIASYVGYGGGFSIPTWPLKM
jgi:hypothetical protein